MDISRQTPKIPNAVTFHTATAIICTAAAATDHTAAAPICTMVKGFRIEKVDPTSLETRHYTIWHYRVLTHDS